jgi:hypothetical protein
MACLSIKGKIPLNLECCIFILFFVNAINGGGLKTVFIKKINLAFSMIAVKKSPRNPYFRTNELDKPYAKGAFGDCLYFTKKPSGKS